MGPWTLLGSAARSYPTTRAKTGRTAHVFTAQGGTRRVSGVFAGVLEESSGKIPGKLLEKFSPEFSRNAMNSRIWGTGKGKPAGDIGSTLA